MDKRPKRPMLQIQMSEEEKALLRQAAGREGYLELSVWVRKLLLDRAHQILKPK